MPHSNFRDSEASLEIVNLLRQVTIFRDLPPEVLGDLATRVHPRAAEAGSIIVSAEEPGDVLEIVTFVGGG